MGRRVLALALAACVPLGALCAPLVHAHADDHLDPAHHGNRVHAHLGGHGTGHHQPRHAGDHDADHNLRHEVWRAAEEIDEHHTGTAEIEESEASEDAVRVQFFVAVDAHAFVGTVPPQGGYRLPPPLESVMRRPPVFVHSHGPPERSTSPSRAPPSHLS